uniref:EB domain-containing protein n=1 Tax=Elaeophora elaphi TaxID=1147741 RepID=A0A158Q7J0_9BILA
MCEETGSTDKRGRSSGMCFALIQLASFFIILRECSSVQYCTNDAQCGGGEQCVPGMDGLLLCQQILNALVPKRIACQNDSECRSSGKCTRLGRHGFCQYGSVAWSTSGLVNDRCYNDADCSDPLHCVNRNGIMTCQVISRMLPYKACRSNEDCELVQICSLSKQHDTNLCMTPEYRKLITGTTEMYPFWSVNIGDGAIPSNMIGIGAILRHFEKQCTADYQVIVFFFSCSVSEICAEGSSISDDRICIYNPTASNRQCRFNADCQSGQRCEKVFENVYLCRAARQTTFMQPCNYDYECSSGQRCVTVSNYVSFQQNLRYCLSLDEEPRCDDDVDCMNGKVCRVSGKVKQCVSVISSSHSTP